MINKLPLVSVILPTFNSARFLRRSIKSVLNQSYKNLELIIIDDCSTDSSLKIIKNFYKTDKRIRYYVTKKNSGTVAIPRNLGILRARGKYVAFLDADDYWMLDKIRYQILNIGKYNFSFTAANYQIEKSLKKSNFLVNMFRIFLQKFFIKKIIKKGNYWLFVYNPFLISSALIKKEVFQTYRFSNKQNIREDLSLWLNIFSKYNKNIIFHPKILLTISRVKNSMSANKIIEFNTVINSISTYFFKRKKDDKFFYFILGILLRTLKLFFSRIYFVTRQHLIVIIFLFLSIYFIFYYTPLFWILGNNLIFHNYQKKTEAIFVLSGHQGFDYYNNSYLDRFVDTIYYLKKYNAKQDTKIFLLGRLSAIPEQKIFEALLINENVKKDNIIVIYKEYNNSFLAMKLLEELVRDNKISSITIITSPYHSLRLKNLWYHVSGGKYDTVFFKHIVMPKKNNFFERSMKKKEITYEILANFYNKIKFKYSNF